jgi:uncharacterized protein (DUF1697 family)
MSVYVGLLRAVNVGSANHVSMAALSKVLLRRGFEDVRTVLQSGNVVFRANAQSPTQLEQALEGIARDELGLNTSFFVRTSTEWRTILEGNPFREEAEADPGHLVVAAFKGTPTAEQWTALQRAIQGRERVRGSGRHGYIVYPDGIGRSKLTPAVIERTLSTQCTSRNWNTVRKLDQLASA